MSIIRISHNDTYTCVLCNQIFKELEVTLITEDFLKFHLRTSALVNEFYFLILENVCDHCAINFKLNPKVQEAKFKHNLGLL